jgi:hypothetical protein
LPHSYLQNIKFLVAVRTIHTSLVGIQNPTNISLPLLFISGPG